MPPSHCVIDRQKRIPAGNDAKSASTVEPVVVKPDVDSKKAATG